MKRRTYRRRPEFESLESMVLLSGIAAAEHEHHAAAAMVATKPVREALISLSGTASGTYRSGRAAGSPYTFTGKGTVSPLGRATVSGSLQLAVSAPTGQITVATRHGKIFASLSTSGLGAPVFYSITGGTGRFAGATGHGAGDLNIVQGHGKGPANGRFTITF